MNEERLKQKERELEEREQRLARREAELTQREKAGTEKEDSEPTQEEVVQLLTAADDTRPPIRRLYDGIPLKALDIFIAVCVVAIIVLTVLGYLDGHGML